MTLIAVILVPFAVSWAACWLMIRLGPKDAPDGARKTQAVPVPSSGGMGVLAGMLAGIAALTALGSPILDLLTVPPLAGVAAFTVLAAFLGWADDVLGLTAMSKLVALVGMALFSILIGPQPAAIWIGGFVIDLPAMVSVPLATLFVFVMANAVNFMDGANGIAMGTSVIILAMLGLLLAPGAALSPDQAAPIALMVMAFVAVAALAGFLAWNLAGRLFAGDAGALSVGGLIGAASLVYAQNGQALVPLTLCLPILVDVFMTLIWRARRGLPLMQAHTDHAYQLLLRAGWSHLQVARVWWGMTAVCAGAVMAGPFAASSGAFSAGALPMDVIVFTALLTAGVWLWLRQRRSMGRDIEGAGSQ